MTRIKGLLYAALRRSRWSEYLPVSHSRLSRQMLLSIAGQWACPGAASYGPSVWSVIVAHRALACVAARRLTAAAP